MSRIGREPIAVPSDVTVTIDGSLVSVKGPKGELSRKFSDHITIEQKDGKVHVTRPNDTIQMKMLHGTCRADIADMITGVEKGYEKRLELKGVGYTAMMNGNNLVLRVGHSHPDTIVPLEGAKIAFDTKTMQIIVTGIDKQIVGQQAALIREVKKPECYHGKGIRYVGEVVVLRQPASAKKSAAGAK